MSHLEEISDAGIRAMAEAGTTAVLLPSTAFILRLSPPPARKMIESGEQVFVEEIIRVSLRNCRVEVF